MGQGAASEADLKRCKPFNPDTAAPLGVRAPFPHVPTVRVGRGQQLKVSEQDKGGKDQLSNNADGGRGGHMSEAHNSQPARPGMSCGARKQGHWRSAPAAQTGKLDIRGWSV